MSNVPRWLLVLVMISACGSRDEKPPARNNQTAAAIPEPPTSAQGSAQTAPDQKVVPPDPATPSPQAARDAVAQLLQRVPPDPKPECIDEGEVLSFDPGELRACFDVNADGDPDRCVRWRRDGKVLAIDSVFNVEDDDAEDTEPEPTFHSDTEHNDDERITLDMDAVDICPYDRICMKLMPRVDDGEIQQVVTDGPYRRAALVVKDELGSSGRVELWDLQTGRLRTKLPFRRLVEDEEYDFSVRMGAAVMIALAENSEAQTSGTIYGLDGGVRGELASGSRTLDAERSFEHAGVFGILDEGPLDEDKPYTVHLHSLSNGQSVGRFTIKRDDDGDDDLAFHTLKRGLVAITQWADQLRLEVIDLRTRTIRVLHAPAC